MRLTMPKIASNAVLPSIVRTRLARDAAVGNVEWYDDIVAATVPPNTSPQSNPGRTVRRAVRRAMTRRGSATARPVVGEEQLLERWLSAEQALHARVRQCGEQRLDRTRHLAAQTVPVHLHRSHA